MHCDGDETAIQICLCPFPPYYDTPEISIPYTAEPFVVEESGDDSGELGARDASGGGWALNADVYYPCARFWFVLGMRRRRGVSGDDTEDDIDLLDVNEQPLHSSNRGSLAHFYTAYYSIQYPPPHFFEESDVDALTSNLLIRRSLLVLILPIILFVSPSQGRSIGSVFFFTIEPILIW